jgi:hypothetical protein
MGVRTPASAVKDLLLRKDANWAWDVSWRGFDESCEFTMVADSFVERAQATAHHSRARLESRPGLDNSSHGYQYSLRILASALPKGSCARFSRTSCLCASREEGYLKLKGHSGPSDRSVTAVGDSVAPSFTAYQAASSCPPGSCANLPFWTARDGLLRRSGGASRMEAFRRRGKSALERSAGWKARLKRRLLRSRLCTRRNASPHRPPLLSGLCSSV